MHCACCLTCSRVVVSAYHRPNRCHSRSRGCAVSTCILCSTWTTGCSPSLPERGSTSVPMGLGRVWLFESCRSSDDSSRFAGLPLAEAGGSEGGSSGDPHIIPIEHSSPARSTTPTYTLLSVLHVCTCNTYVYIYRVFCRSIHVCIYINMHVCVYRLYRLP